MVGVREASETALLATAWEHYEALMAAKRFWRD
jgi:hypothetical protein